MIGTYHMRMLFWIDTMTSLRLPESLVPMFKELSSDTSRRLTKRLGSPYIGRKLLNDFSRSLGHKDYNSLLHDSKQYGNGPLDLQDFLYRILLVEFKIDLNILKFDYLIAVFEAFTSVMEKMNLDCPSDILLQEAVNKALAKRGLRVLGINPFHKYWKQITPNKLSSTFSHIQFRLRKIMLGKNNATSTIRKQHQLFSQQIESIFLHIKANGNDVQLSSFLFLQNEVLDEMEFTNISAEQSLAVHNLQRWLSDLPFFELAHITDC